MAHLKANTDAPFGLEPYTAALRINEYTKSSATDIFRGNVVVLLSTGLATSCQDPTLSPIMVIGVAAETTLSASAGTTVMVYDHPDQLYVCQEDGVGTALAQTHVGNLFPITGLTPATAAQVSLGQSITEMDTSGTSVTLGGGQDGLLLQFIKLHPIESGFASAAGSPRKVVVKLLAGKHWFATQSGAI